MQREGFGKGTSRLKCITYVHTLTCTPMYTRPTGKRRLKDAVWMLLLLGTSVGVFMRSIQIQPIKEQEGGPGQLAQVGLQEDCGCWGFEPATCRMGGRSPQPLNLPLSQYVTVPRNTHTNLNVDWDTEKHTHTHKVTRTHIQPPPPKDHWPGLRGLVS